MKLFHRHKWEETRRQTITATGNPFSVIIIDRCSKCGGKQAVQYFADHALILYVEYAEELVAKLASLEEEKRKFEGSYCAKAYQSFPCEEGNAKA